MLRRWGILLVMLALTAGAVLTASSASAATGGARGFRPGGPVHLVGASAHALGISHQAQSTNWSGYAATTGTYTTVSASWTQPIRICSRGDQNPAFWAGLDGYTPSSEDHPGTEADSTGRTPPDHP